MYRLSLYTAFSVFLNSLLFINATAQTPQWQWAKGVSSSDEHVGRAVSVSSSGSIFVAGTYENTPMTLGSTTLANSGSTDVFIARYDAAGNVLWAKQIGSTGAETVTASTIDNQGNFIVAGCYRSSTITIGVYTLYNPVPGQLMSFVARYDANGQAVWSGNATGDSSTIIKGVAVDESNNIYVTGGATGNVFYIGFTAVHHKGYFVAKYNTAGNIVWVQTLSEPGNSYGYGIQADKQGHFYVTGQFSTPTASFASLVVNPTGTTGMFVAKYDTAGNALWARGATGGNYSSGQGITTDKDGNVIVGGQYSGAGLDMGAGAMPYSLYEVNGFLAKYDKDGNVKWAKTIQGSWQTVTNVVADNDGYIYTTGFNSGPSVTFPPIVIYNQANGQNEGFIAKYTGAGILLWVRPISSIGDDRASACSVAPDGSIYVTGTNSGDVTLGSSVLPASGTPAFFIAKLSNSNTSIINASTNTNATIYPNPCNGHFYITGAPQGSVLRITNMLGAVVYQASIDKEKQQVDIPGVCQGMYFYQLTNGEQPVLAGKIAVD